MYSTTKEIKKTERSITILTMHLSNGGAERVFGLLSNEWARMGFCVSIVELDPNMAGEDHYLTDPRVKIYKYHFSGFGIIRKLKMIVTILSWMVKFKGRCIVFHYAVMRLLFLIFPFVKRDVILSERCDPYSFKAGGIIPSNIQRKMIDFMFEKVARVCVFQTHDAMNYFDDVVRNKGIVIPNPVNPNLPKLFNGIRRKVIIAAGSLTESKNFQMCFKAFAKFSCYHPDFVLEHYGRGNLEKELKVLIHQLGMDNKILLKGFSVNVNDAMRDCTLFVSSSNSEGISNSMIEAMAMGMPVVCTDCPIGGARMMIQNGVNGLLVPVGDEEALYLAFRRLVEEPDFADRLGREAYKIREQFSVERIANKWVDTIFETENSTYGIGSDL